MAQRVKVYEITIQGQEPEVMRSTAKRAQSRLRTLHRDGIKASMRCLKNKAEQRAALAA